MAPSKIKKPKHDHDHLRVPLHSREQAAMFYALAAELGFDSEKVKKRAQDKAGVDCFNKIKSSQINDMIDKMQQLQERRGGKDATTQ